MPGGGGLGDPFARDPERVAEDVRLGMVSRAAASRDYGVILHDDDTVDRDATRATRRQSPRSRQALPDSRRSPSCSSTVIGPQTGSHHSASP